MYQLTKLNGSFRGDKPMYFRFALLALGCLALAGCGVPGHTHAPFEAHEIIPVQFYGGRVLSVQWAAIGSPVGGAGIVADLAPGVILGAGGAPGRNTGGARGGIVVGGVAIGAEAEQPAAGLEYTIAVDNTPQVVQITQYALPEDCIVHAPGQPCALTPIPPGAPVVIRVVGTKARVYPLSMVPPYPDMQARIAHGPIPIGPVLALASPPHFFSPHARCFDPGGNPIGCERFVYPHR